MAWIKSEESIVNHPKTLKLASDMEWCVDQTIGKLHRFWYWCLNYAPTGDLRGYNDAVLAGSVGLEPTSAHRFVTAMVASGWIDRDSDVFRVHDWIDHARIYLRDVKFKNRPDLWKKTEEVYVSRVFADNPQISCGKSAVERESRREKPPNPQGGVLEGFARFWSQWPRHDRKVDKAGCEKAWIKHGCEPIAASVIAGLERTKQGRDWTKNDGEFIPAPKVWLNQRRWEASVTPAPQPESDWRQPVTPEVEACFLGKLAGEP